MKNIGILGPFTTSLLHTRGDIHAHLATRETSSCRLWVCLFLWHFCHGKGKNLNLSLYKLCHPWCFWGGSWWVLKETPIDVSRGKMSMDVTPKRKNWVVLHKFITEQIENWYISSIHTPRNWKWADPQKKKKKSLGNKKEILARLA